MIIQVDPTSGIIPQGPDQVTMTIDEVPLVGQTQPASPTQIQVVAPDGTLLPPGVLGVGPDGKPLPEGVAPLGPDGKPLPEGVFACGPDGKPLPPGVLGVGPDSMPLPPGIHPRSPDGKPLPTGSAQPGPPGTQPLVGAVAPMRKATPKNRKELIAELDWWSKYYITLEDIHKEEAEKQKGKLFTSFLTASDA